MHVHFLIYVHYCGVVIAQFRSVVCLRAVFHPRIGKSRGPVTSTKPIIRPTPFMNVVTHAPEVQEVHIFGKFMHASRRSCIESAATLRIHSCIPLLLFAKRCLYGNSCSTSRDNTSLTLDGLAISQLFMKSRDSGWNTSLRSEVGYSHSGYACVSPTLEQLAYAVLSC